jgi:hypothetical protein
MRDSSGELPVVVEEPSPEGTSSIRDLRLALARRIDWRFLLPNPELGRVAIVGRADGELAAALEIFAASVRVPGDSSAEEGSFDVAILFSTEASNLKRAHHLLREGGSLYIELDRKQSREVRAARPGASIRKSLEALGFEDVECYWHHPSFASCLEILPLDHPGVLEKALARRGSRSLRGRMAGAAARIFGMAGRLSPAIACWSVVASKGRAS